MTDHEIASLREQLKQEIIKEIEESNRSKDLESNYNLKRAQKRDELKTYFYKKIKDQKIETHLVGVCNYIIGGLPTLERTPRHSPFQHCDTKEEFNELLIKYEFIYKQLTNNIVDMIDYFNNGGNENEEN